MYHSIFHFFWELNIKMLYMRGMKVYVPGKTLILSNFTGKNSDRIFRPGICIDIAHNIATKKDNTHIVSKYHNNSGINIIQKCFDMIMFTTWSISISEIRTYVWKPIKHFIPESNLFWQRRGSIAKVAPLDNSVWYSHVTKTRQTCLLNWRHFVFHN